MSGHRILNIFAILLSIQASSLLADTTLLGSGYSTAGGKLKDSCIEGEVVYTQNSFQELEYITAYSIKEQIEKIWGNLGIGAGFLGFGFSSSLAYLSKTIQSDLSLTLLLSYSTKLGSAIYKSHSLNEKGLKAIKGDGHEFLSICGDSFVYKQDLGSKLFISATLHFRNRATLKKFIHRVEISALFGLFTKTKEFVKKIEGFASDAYLVVDAYQLGGRPDSLHAIVDSLQQKPCKLDEPGRCVVVLNNLLDYASSLEGYRGQFLLSSPPTKRELDSLAVLKTDIVSYHESGYSQLSFPTGTRTTRLKSMPMHYIDKLASLYVVKERIDFLLASSLRQKDHPLLLKKKTVVEMHIEKYKKLIDFCRDNHEHDDCLQRSRSTLDPDEKLDQSLLTF